MYFLKERRISLNPSQQLTPVGSKSSSAGMLSNTFLPRDSKTSTIPVSVLAL